MRRDLEWYADENSIASAAQIEALVAEAERGYDGRLKVQVVGRREDPALEGLRRIVFRVQPRVRTAAQKRADELGVSMSEFAAEALREHLKRTRVRPARKDS